MNMHKGRIILALTGASLLLAQTAHGPNRLAHAAAGIATLQNWYIESTGLWIATGWWNSANAVTVLVDYGRLSGDSRYLPAVANTFDRNEAGGFLNKFYDDEGWWALAWIDAYDWTQDQRYLDMASQIFSNMQGGWDDTCGGGLWWSKDRTYKNAIPNELFLTVAARLAARTGDSAALDWANREWQWFAQSGMINAQGLVNDGLTSACKNNGKTPWTYNQGVILGGLAALYRQTGDAALLDQAHAIAHAAIANLTDSGGILHETCEPKCGADGQQFKGIFARNLRALNAASPRPEYAAFLRANAASIWSHDRGPDNQFGQVWSGPFTVATVATQVSALDALLGAGSLDAAPRKRKPPR